MRTDPGPAPDFDSTNVMRDPEVRRLARRALRRAAIARREALASETVAGWSEAICDNLQRCYPQLAQQRVAFCWPIRNEPDLRPLIEAWLRAGHPDFVPLLPVVTAPDAGLAFRRWHPDAHLTLDRHGIPMPSTGDFIVPDALLIPLNAFDAQGYRLGYGGGYFDRSLANAHPRPLAIGIGFELARVDSVEPEAHDVRLDAIVTEKGIMRPVVPNACGGPPRQGALDGIPDPR